MLNIPNGKVTITQVLLPLSLVAFVLCLWLAFELTQILHERDALHQASAQQEKPLEDVQHLQTQLSALANGTIGLAEKGDKNAKAIVERMKQMGLLNPNAPGTPAAEPSALNAIGRGTASPPPPPQPPPPSDR